MKKREIIELGDLEVDLEARRVSRGGEEIQLGRLSFELLEALIRAAPAALSTEEIVQAVWAGDIVTDETVKQRVSLLRRALGQGNGREYVATLRGHGYRLGIEIAETGSPRVGSSRSDGVRGRLPRILILGLVILSLLLLVTMLATAIRRVKRMSGLESGGGEPRVELSRGSRPAGTSKLPGVLFRTSDER